MENNQSVHEVDSSSRTRRIVGRILGAVGVTGLLVFGGAKLLEGLDGGTIGEGRIDVPVEPDGTITGIVEVTTENNGCDIRKIIDVVIRENDGDSSLEAGESISVPVECNG